MDTMKIHVRSECISNRWRQYVAVTFATLTMFTSGNHYSWTSPSLPKLYANDSSIPTTVEDGSWLGSISLLGELFGSPVGAFVADYLGRKDAIILSVLPYFVAWIMVMFANSLSVLLAARFIVGIADGAAYTILPMYIGEMADKDIRGRLANFIPIMFNFGSLFIYAIGPYVSISTMAAIAIAGPIIIYAGFPWFPESPYQLLIKGKNDMAKVALQKFRGRDDVDDELNEMNQVVIKDSTMSSSWGELLTTKGNVKALLIVLGLKIAQQFSGIAAVLVYTEIIFKAAGGGISASISAIILGTVQLIFSFFAAIVVDLVGRKPLLIASCLGCGICLGAQATYFLFQTSDNISNFAWLPVTAMVTYIIMYSYGLGAIPYIMPSEVFPTNIKAKAMCLTDLCFSLAAFLVTRLYQSFANEYGSHVPFYFFMASCFICCLFIVLFLPETKGKSLEEIQDILKGNSPKNIDTAQKIESIQLGTKPKIVFQDKFVQLTVT